MPLTNFPEGTDAPKADWSDGDVAQGQHAEYLNQVGSAVPAMQRWLQELPVVPPSRYGLTIGSTADQAAKLQDFSDDAHDSGGKILELPGRLDGPLFSIKSPITLRRGAVLSGQGRMAPPTGGYTYEAAPGTTFPGATVDIEHGEGTLTGATITVERGAMAQGLTFRHPSQSATAPVAFPWLFDCARGSGNWGQALVNICAINPYQYVRASCEKLWVQNLVGQPLYRGLDLEGVTDTCHVRGLHFWTYWKEWDAASALAQWQLTNGWGLRVGRCDGFDIADVLMFGYARGIVFQNAADASLAPFGQLRGVKLDGMHHGIVHERSSHEIQISQLWIHATYQDLDGNEPRPILFTDGRNLGVIRIVDSYLAGVRGNGTFNKAATNLVEIQSAVLGQRIELTNCSLREWSPAAGAAAIKVAANHRDFQLQLTAPSFELDEPGTYHLDVSALDKHTDSAIRLNGGYFGTARAEPRIKYGATKAPIRMYEDRVGPPGSRSVVEDDFTSGNTTTGSIGLLGWTLADTASGGSAANQAAEADHPGIIRLGTGTYAGAVGPPLIPPGNVRILRAKGSNTVFDAAETFDLSFVVRPNQNNADADAQYWYGAFVNLATPDATHGAFFRRAAAGANWHAVCRDGTTGGDETDLDLGIAQALGWTKLRIRRRRVAGTGTIFFVVGDDPLTLASGTATGGTTATLVDAGASWATNRWIDCSVLITGGTGVGQRGIVVSNNGTTLTIWIAWAVAPDATSTYQIVGNAQAIQSHLPQTGQILDVAAVIGNHATANAKTHDIDWMRLAINGLAR